MKRSIVNQLVIIDLFPFKNIIINIPRFIAILLINFIFIFVSPVKALAQDKLVKYSYDLNGNRIKRWIEIQKIMKTDTVDSLYQSPVSTNQLDNYCDNEKIVISIFPNPTQGFLDLRISGLRNGELVEYRILSIKGQELIRNNTALPLTKIDISNFVPGNYFLKVIQNKKIETWKLIKT